MSGLAKVALDTSYVQGIPIDGYVTGTKLRFHSKKKSGYTDCLIDCNVRVQAEILIVEESLLELAQGGGDLLGSHPQCWNGVFVLDGEDGSSREER